MHGENGSGGFAEGLQTGVMAFNKLIFRGIPYARASKHKTVGATLQWLKVSYPYKLQALELQQAIKGTELQLKNTQPPLNH